MDWIFPVTPMNVIPRHLASKMQLLSLNMQSTRRRLTMSDVEKNAEKTMEKSEPQQEQPATINTTNTETKLMNVNPSLLDHVDDIDSTTVTVIPRLLINLSVTDNSNHSDGDFNEISKALGYSIANPFRPANEEKKKKQGFLRRTVIDTFKYLNLIHNRPVTIFGDNSQVNTALEKMTKQTLHKVLQLLPKLEDDANIYDLSSVFRIDAWPSIVSDGSGETLAYVNVVFSVNSPAVYVADDKVKIVKQMVTLLTALLEKHECKFPCLLSVTVSTDQLRYSSVRDLLDLLTLEDTEDKKESTYVMLTRSAIINQLEQGNTSDMLPCLPENPTYQDYNNVVSRLLAYGGDMLFIKE
jgi:hypothetical protein